jgi:hypothetical protein
MRSLRQWDVDLDIDWTVSGQIDRARDLGNPLNRFQVPVGGGLSASRLAELGHASAAWTVSQFLHTEQPRTGPALASRPGARPPETRTARPRVRRCLCSVCVLAPPTTPPAHSCSP